MIEVRTRRGQTHRGKSPQSIARRLYGRRAWVAVGSTANLGINGYAEANVLTPATGEHVAVVEDVWLLDEAALDAAAAVLLAEDTGRGTS